MTDVRRDGASRRLSSGSRNSNNNDNSHPSRSDRNNNPSQRLLLDDDSSEEGPGDTHTDLLEFPSSVRGVMRTQSLQAMRRPEEAAAMTTTSRPRLAPPSNRTRRVARSLSSDDGPIFRRSAPLRAQSHSESSSGNRKLSAALVGFRVTAPKLEHKEISRGVGRYASFDSTLSCASDLESTFTTDSINLRKHQLIADPLDDGVSYVADDSAADHESMYDNMSQWSREYYDELLEYLPEDQPIYDKDYMVMVEGGDPMMQEGTVAYLTLDALQLRRPNMMIVTDQQCDMAGMSSSSRRDHNSSEGGDDESSSERSLSVPGGDDAESRSETTEHMDDLDDTNEYDETTNGEDPTDETD